MRPELLGEDETHISTVDSEGVALAAIQALNQEKQQQADRRLFQELRIEALVDFALMGRVTVRLSPSILAARKQLPGDFFSRVDSIQL